MHYYSTRCFKGFGNGVVVEGKWSLFSLICIGLKILFYKSTKRDISAILKKEAFIENKCASQQM